MGTIFFYDEMLPVHRYSKSAGSRRQVEVFRPSGTSDIMLRIGNLDEQHMGRGAEVELNQKTALELIEAIETAFFCSGRSLPGRRKS